MVTGAGRGIGLGLVTALLARGDSVVATARDLALAPTTQGHTAKGRVLQSLAASAGDRLTLLEMEVTDSASVAAAAAALGGQPVDVLVNNAGVYGPRPQGPLDVDLAAFADTLAVNTVAPFRVLQAFAPNLIEAARTRGVPAKVATISSTMGSVTGTSTGFLAYRASKAAVNKAVQASAGDLAARGIVSVVIHPGWVRTDMGGPGADISVEESATGIIATIDRLTAGDAGSFLNWDGSRAPW
jgi:NAD(P)-dependent dehydrogenase (short-subunit alcohol dehydrogenase family)